MIILVLIDGVSDALLKMMLNFSLLIYGLSFSENYLQTIVLTVLNQFQI